MAQGSSICGVDAVVVSTPVQRGCTVCGEPIPAKRLQVLPGAQKCVECLEASGDVPRYKRFDEYTPSGDKVETIFIRDSRIEEQMAHLNNDSPTAEDYISALGQSTEIDAKPSAHEIDELIEDEDLEELIEPEDQEPLEDEEPDESDAYQTRKEKIALYYSGEPQHFAAAAA